MFVLLNKVHLKFCHPLVFNHSVLEARLCLSGSKSSLCSSGWCCATNQPYYSITWMIIAILCGRICEGSARSEKQSRSVRQTNSKHPALHALSVHRGDLPLREGRPSLRPFSIWQWNVEQIEGYASRLKHTPLPCGFSSFTHHSPTCSQLFIVNAPH